jgi:hypothetical protein
VSLRSLERGVGMSTSDRKAFRDRHRQVLDLLDAWARDEDADVSNLADALADKPQAACHAMTRVLDTAVRMWADDCGLDPARARDRLRSALEQDIGGHRGR